MRLGSLDDLVNVLKGVSQEHRLRILTLLDERGPMTFSELRDMMNIKSGKLNFHLKKLMRANLVMVSSEGRYTLTEFGRWVLAKVREMQFGERKNSVLLTSYRGIAVGAGDVERVASVVGCRPKPEELTALLGKLMESIRRWEAPTIDAEVLAVIVETLLCGMEPRYVCVPRSVEQVAFKSLTDDTYAQYRGDLVEALASRYALKRLSPVLYEYQMRGLIYVKDPALSLGGIPLLALGASTLRSVARAITRVVARAAEVVLFVEELEREDLEIIDVLPPDYRRLTLVLEEPPSEDLLPAINVALTIKAGNEVAAALPAMANRPVPLLVFRGDRVPSLTLASLPLPEPGRAYVVPLRTAVSLPAAVSRASELGVDSRRALELVAGECLRVAERYNYAAVRRALRGVVDGVEVLQPQLAILGFESALRRSYPILQASSLVGLTKRFWGSVAKDLPVAVTAALADRNAYSILPDGASSPLSAFHLSGRKIEDLALLEGALQGVLGGGSTFAVRVRGYLTAQAAAEVVRLAEMYGVSNISFHLEFTVCSACGAVVNGRRGVCDACLSSSVTNLVRPLATYEPLDAVPPEVLREYEARTYIE